MIGVNCNIIFNIFPNEVHASKFYCHKSLLQSIGSENTTMHSLFRRALSGLGIDLDLDCTLYGCTIPLIKILFQIITPPYLGEVS